MKYQRLIGLLAFTLLISSFFTITNAQNKNSIWRDDMNYSSSSQLETAGWTLQHQEGISFTTDGIVLGGANGDTAIHYSNKFPSGINDWIVEVRSRWVSGSHSGNGVSAVTNQHSYGFSADGWYSNFAFYRDNQKILTFGSYQEQSNQWLTLKMEKNGNKIDMYFNDVLQNSYTESDTTPSQIIGVNLISPWLGAAEIDYYQLSTIKQAATADSWSMFGHDISNARYSTSSAPKTSQILWSTALDAEVRTSVTIVGNVAYLGTFGSTVYALDASTGKVIWSHGTDGYIWSTPAVTNGKVFIGSNDFNLYALNTETGNEIWRFPTGGAIFSSPIVVDNVVYVGSTDKNFYAIDANTGVQIWKFTARGEIRSSAAFFNNVIFFGCFVDGGNGLNDDNGYLYALSASSGTEIWSAPTGDGDTYTSSSPAIVDHVAYVGSTNGNLYAFRIADGSKIWNYTTSGSVSTAPAVHNGLVYVGSYNNSNSGDFYAIDCDTGALVWSYPVGARIYSSPAVADGVVYFGTWDNWVYALDASSGSLVWSYETGLGVFSSPTISCGVMFVGSYDRKVYAFGTEFNSGATSSESMDYVVKTPWVPPPAGGVVATVVTVGAVSASAIVAAAVSTVPAAASVGFVDKLIGKVRDLLPTTVKKWLESLISSKRKLKVEEKTGPAYLLTRPEVIVYSLAIFILTFSFAYVKVNTFAEFLAVLPTFILTSLIVGFIKTYFLITFARTRGVWAEYKLWYFGIAMYIISTVAFRLPFSSPTRNVYHSKNMTSRLGFILSCIGIFVTLAFAGLFLVIQNAGFALIGSSGLGMCLIGAFFDTLPIKPMGGASIFQYNKKYWAILFLITMILYGIWLLQSL